MGSEMCIRDRGNTAYRQIFTAEKRKTAYRQNITAVLHYHRKIPPYLGFTASAKKVPPTLDTAKKYRQLSIPPKEYRQLSMPLKRYHQHWIPPKRYRRHWISPKRYRRYWIPPKRYRVQAQKVPRTLDTAPKTTGFSFVFVLCSLVFLVLRVPSRSNLFVDVCTERRPRTCPYTCPHTCPHHAQRGPAEQ